MTIEVTLGKITEARFGFGGYQEAQIGLWLTFSNDSWSVNTGYGGGWSTTHVTPNEHSKWTEEDRSKGFDKLVRDVNQLLSDAKVMHVAQLVGVPVEVTFEDLRFKSFRVLKEVL